MLTELRKMDEHGENFNKETENKKMPKSSHRAEEYNNWTIAEYNNW